MTKAESAGSVTQKTHFADDETLARMAALELEAADLRERLAKARELMRMAADRIETCEEIISETSGRIFEVDLINELRALSQKGADHE